MEDEVEQTSYMPPQVLVAAHLLYGTTIAIERMESKTNNHTGILVYAISGFTRNHEKRMQKTLKSFWAEHSRKRRKDTG